MKIFKRIMNKIEPEYITLQKHSPNFTTTDGEYHIGLPFKWINASRIICPVSEYFMIGVKSDGYIYDENCIMYPLTNILSIEWEKIGEVSVVDNFSDYQIVFDNDELSN